MVTEHLLQLLALIVHGFEVARTNKTTCIVEDSFYSGDDVISHLACFLAPSSRDTFKL